MPIKNKIEFPVPNTRFIFIAEQQTDGSWDIFVVDPSNNDDKKEIKKGVSNAVFSLFKTTMSIFNTDNSKKKEIDLDQIKKSTNKIIKAYEKRNKRNIKRTSRSNQQGKRNKVNRARRPQNGTNKPNTSRNGKIGKRNKTNKRIPNR